jgi:hypothetical protein
LTAGSGTTVQLTDQVKVNGRLLTLSGAATIGVSRNVIGIHVTSLTGAAQSIVSSLLSSLGVALPLQQLPFRLALLSVSVNSDGITATGEATQVVLGS